MGVIINLELAYNRHTLENGLLIILRKSFPYRFVCVYVCVEYTIDIRKSMC
jgi:hypothetical protein